ncbi:MAG TPA: hypothetical protein VJ725_19875 [Thermoanaerobaculia bacterium]|nr:hypothetical protein [Thermoanaerobaculia bacterium]
MSESELTEEGWEFQIKTVSPALAEKDVRKLLEEALQEALAEARQKQGGDLDARAELRGAFGGAGELVALLVFLGKAVLGGAAGAAGKHFFDSYLKPKLERRGLFPSGLKRETERKP